MPAFDPQNFTDLIGICLHLSIWAATTRTACRLSCRVLRRRFPPAHAPLRQQSSSVFAEKSASPSGKIELLTARELQIVELVALGRTNAEIGTELWIAENSVKQALKRMFRKLKASSRAEMVAQLSTG